LAQATRDIQSARGARARPGGDGSCNAGPDAGSAIAAPSSGGAPRTAEPRRQQADVTEATIPYILRRQLVYFRTTYAGTVIVIKPQHSLYLVRITDGHALSRSGLARLRQPAALLVVDRKDGGPGNTPVIAAADRPSPQARDRCAVGCRLSISATHQLHPGH
jgi:hypothetical protein